MKKIRTRNICLIVSIIIILCIIIGFLLINVLSENVTHGFLENREECFVQAQELITIDTKAFKDKKLEEKKMSEETLARQTLENTINIGREEILLVNVAKELSNEVYPTLEENMKNWNSFLICENDDKYISGTINDMAEKYLLAKGVDSSKPDGVYYLNDEVDAKYYYNVEKNEVSFVINFPYEVEDVICVTFDLDNAKKEGYIDFELDSEGYTVAESSHNSNSPESFDVKYRYVEDVPITFITNYENIDEETISNYKFQQWDKYIHYYYEENFDEYGRLVALGKGDTQFEVEYNEENRIARLDRMAKDLYGEPSEQYEDFIYESGKLVQSEYFYHGSTDGSGLVIYDNMGRVIYNSYYITHGRVYNFYLYEGDSRRPDGIVSYDTFSMNGSEVDSVAYSYGSSYAYLYMFKDVEK